MLKYFCDCCGVEIMRKGKVFSWASHITELAQDKIPDYCDHTGQSVSDKVDSVELCPKCYNEILILSVQKYFELKK
jgi:hypothetical protein